MRKAEGPEGTSCLARPVASGPLASSRDRPFYTIIRIDRYEEISSGLRPGDHRLGRCGFAAAIAAGNRGLSVVMVERSTMGGTCVNVGCIPSKVLLAAAEALNVASEARFPGVASQAPPVDMAGLVGGKAEIVGVLRKEKYEDLAADYGWRMSEVIAEVLSEEGVEVRTSARLAEVARDAGGVRVRSADGVGGWVVVKIVAEVTTGKVVGIHVAAEGAGDAILAATYALEAGMTVEQLASTWAPYLTMAEGIKLAAQSFTTDVAKLSCCAA